MTEPKRVAVLLTSSERLALLAVLIEHWQGCENITEEFIDTSTEPPTVVRYGDLLTIFSRMVDNLPSGESQGVA